MSDPIDLDAIMVEYRSAMARVGLTVQALLAEVERLRAENATLRGHAPWWMAPLRATGKGLRGIEVARAAQATLANGQLGDHDPDDCPTCCHALRLPDPGHAAETARTGTG
jgi:hypothetical protein